MANFSGTSSAIVPMMTFDLFPELPTELRLNVFRRAVPKEKRIIEVHCRRADGSYYAEGTIPALLHTNFEARAVAMVSLKFTLLPRYCLTLRETMCQHQGSPEELPNHTLYPRTFLETIN